MRSQLMNEMRRRLPLVVGSAVESRLTGIRMHVSHSCGGLVGAQDYAIELRHPILGVGHGVGWHGAEVAGLLKIIHGLRRGLLDQRVIIDGVTNRAKVGSQY